MEIKQEQMMVAKIFACLADDVRAIRAAGPCGYWNEKLSKKLDERADALAKAARDES